jgi:hypothetical protein
MRQARHEIEPLVELHQWQEKNAARNLLVESAYRGYRVSVHPKSRLDDVDHDGTRAFRGG